MSIPRRTLWLLASAIPTLVITAWALWVLHDFLAVRDRLGLWRITITTVAADTAGVAAGSGTLDLRAESWSVAWQSQAPFVAFTPNLNGSTGRIHLLPAGIAVLSTYFGATWPSDTLDFSSAANPRDDLRTYWVRPRAYPTPWFVAFSLFEVKPYLYLCDPATGAWTLVLQTSVER